MYVLTCVSVCMNVDVCTAEVFWKGLKSWFVQMGVTDRVVGSVSYDIIK